jgi:ATP-dependent RNA helicase RhlE
VTAAAFEALGVGPALAGQLAAAAVVEPTPVQAAAVPPALAGRDVQAQAPTGSGKTLAFALPLLQGLQPPAQPRRTQALVLVPTRELAVQVGGVLRGLAGAAAGARVALLFGGVSINPQLMALRGGTDIAVATPGRLLDVVAHNGLALDAVRTLVLDEADRLLDLGFADELARVLALLPPRRQTLLFSATFPDAVQALAAALLRDPVPVAVQGPASGEPAIAQRAIAVDAARRTAVLRQLIGTHGWKRTLVFVGTQHAADHVAAKLYAAGVYATPLHGGLAQGARQRALDDFAAGRWDVLVTTDLAARGLHIDGLDAVVNYDLPRSPTDYTHRIGRTGRAGASGAAVSLVPPAAEQHFRLIEKRQGQPVPREVLDGFAPTETAPPPTPGGGGVKGLRPSKKDKLRAAAAAAAAAKPDTP